VNVASLNGGLIVHYFHSFWVSHRYTVAICFGSLVNIFVRL